MTIQTQPIIIDPASIIAVGAMRAKRAGRPKKGDSVGRLGKVRAYNLSEDAHKAVTAAAVALGVSESAVVEVLAKSLIGCFQTE